MVAEPPRKPVGVTDRTWQTLQPKARAFVAAFLKDRNAFAAYEKAGYDLGSTAPTSVKGKRRAYSVLKGKAVRQAIWEQSQHVASLSEAHQQFALDWIVSEHERLMHAAEEKGDLAVATRNLELIGRTRGLYREGVQLDITARREYSEAEQVEAGRIAALLLRDAEAEVVSVEVEEPGEESAGTSAPLSSPSVPVG